MRAKGKVEKSSRNVLLSFSFRLQNNLTKNSNVVFLGLRLRNVNKVGGIIFVTTLSLARSKRPANYSADVTDLINISGVTRAQNPTGYPGRVLVLIGIILYLLLLCDQNTRPLNGGRGRLKIWIVSKSCLTMTNLHRYA